MDNPLIVQPALLVLARVVTMLVGFGFCYLGYKLYVSGVLQREGDLDIEIGEKKRIRLRDAAPGLFFGLFGMAIVSLQVIRGTTFNSRGNNFEATGNAVSAGAERHTDYRTLARNEEYDWEFHGEDGESEGD